METNNINYSNSCLISILVPVFNVEKYIAQTLDSVLNQTYKNFKLIILDDCSTDSSYDICVSYKQKFEKAKIEYKILKNTSNQGVGYCVDKLLKHVDTSYFLQLDSDDFLISNSIERYVDIISKEKPDIVLSDLDSYDENLNNKIRCQAFGTSDRKILIKNFIKIKNVHFVIQLIKTDSFIKSNGDMSIVPSKEGQNFQLILPMLMKNMKIINIEKSFIKYRERTNSHHRIKKNLTGAKSRLKSFYKIVKITLNKCHDYNIMHYIWNFHRYHDYLVKLYLSKGLRSKAIFNSIFCSFTFKKTLIKKTMHKFKTFFKR